MHFFVGKRHVYDVIRIAFPFTYTVKFMFVGVRHSKTQQIKLGCACLRTRWKYDVIYITFLALDVIL